jgi:hypothetical protein
VSPAPTDGTGRTVESIEYGASFQTTARPVEAPGPHFPVLSFSSLPSIPPSILPRLEHCTYYVAGNNGSTVARPPSSTMCAGESCVSICVAFPTISTTPTSVSYHAGGARTGPLRLSAERRFSRSKGHARPCSSRWNSPRRLLPAERPGQHDSHPELPHQRTDSARPSIVRPLKALVPW